MVVETCAHLSAFIDPKKGEKAEMEREEGIQMNLFRYFNDTDFFTLDDAKDAVLNHYQQDVKDPSIRARIYEGIDKGLFQRVSKGVYTVTKKNEQGKESTCMLINGDGRDLSFIEDNSIDALITDHPYKMDKALKGGNRDFAKYELFQYEQKDFNEKLRVLKPGAFLLEFLPDESEVNFEYLYNVKKMALEAGFKYFAKVPWKKGNYVANTGRTQKNREDIMFFTKGEARALKLNTKKNKEIALKNGLDVKGLDSYELRDLLEEHGLEVAFMKGTAGMLPTEFDYQPRSKKEKLMEAEKPVELFDAILPYITTPGEKVLDQFGGSMNIAISAVKNGRDAIVIEKDKEMFEKAKRHVEEALKEKAMLIEKIDGLYEEIKKNDEELELEYRENGETVWASQLERQNERLEKDIIHKEEQVMVLSKEEECYTEAMKNTGFYKDNQQKEFSSDKAEELKNSNGLMSKIDFASKISEDLNRENEEMNSVVIHSIKPWQKVIGDSLVLHRLYMKIEQNNYFHEIWYDFNNDRWGCRGKMLTPLNYDAIEKKMLEVTGVKSKKELKDIDSKYQYDKKKIEAKQKQQSKEVIL